MKLNPDTAEMEIIQESHLLEDRLRELHLSQNNARTWIGSLLVGRRITKVERQLSEVQAFEQGT